MAVTKSGLERGELRMYFDKDDFTQDILTFGGSTVRFRSWRNLIYVVRPVDIKYQRMNLFIPEAYFEGGKINGYSSGSAPVFMPNTVGGYMPGNAGEPGCVSPEQDEPNSILGALAHGYVVAAPALRGRTLKALDGSFTGKAPACIVDYKAAVRFLRYFTTDLPGDKNKIITNGTSAGGALSALMGASGNHPDYEPWLQEVGAADARDDVFAASCYCPITDLEHADMAYEWQFLGVNEYRRSRMVMKEGGCPAFLPEEGLMDAAEIRASCGEAALFPSYINSLRLIACDGRPLTLEADGSGPFAEYVKRIVLRSAQTAIDQGKDLSSKSWLRQENGRAVSVDFDGYVRDITRMKTAPAFDALTMDTAENSLFGSRWEDCRHFTAYSLENSLAGAGMAEEEIVRVMNPTRYIRDARAVTAKRWRIRHGERDRDTSLAVSAILALLLQEQGNEVDYCAPWDTPHSGDYDLDGLFAWIDQICR